MQWWAMQLRNSRTPLHGAPVSSPAHFGRIAGEDTGAPRMRLLAVLLLLLAAMSLSAQTPLTVNRSQAIYTEELPFTLWGTAPPNSIVTITVDPASGTQPVTTATAVDGSWNVLWTQPLKTGTYDVKVSAAGQTVTEVLRVQIRGNIPRQSAIEEKPNYKQIESFDTAKNIEVTDRWRIVPPPYELDENPRGRALGKKITPDSAAALDKSVNRRAGATLDPYNKNLLKGDYPIRGNDTFFVFTGISDTTIEGRTLPTPSGPAAQRPKSFPFFGNTDQGVFIQNLILSGDLYRGLTTFQPVKDRVKATVVANFNHVNVAEVGLVKPDVRRGSSRSDTQVAVQELFYEHRLLDLSPNFDFISVRAGSQPFSSDFRGFIFSDTNLGLRIFGNYGSNRYQYNLAVFNRFEKDTNSGLNRLFVYRDQRVAVANFYMQDFFKRGYTQSFSFHYQDDHPEEELVYDRNGGLVRPAPLGNFKTHNIKAYYVGEAGLGHIGKYNIDQAVYYVFGTDSENPIAGPDPELRRGPGIDISAGMAAFEISYDRDWLRPRFAVFYATGDGKPRDREGRGFDSIFDSPAFAGGGFSFYNRLGIRLTGTGVTLVDRGSLLNSLRSSKEEGQSNFVNPGIQLVSLGLDIDVTPRLKAILTGNYIRMDKTESVEAVLFQGDIDKDLGTDLSIGLKYRPVLNNQWIVVGGIAGFIPASGWKAIYEKDNPLYQVFTNVILQF